MNINQQWEIKFDEKFGGYPYEIKEFIRDLFSKERERVVGEVFNYLSKEMRGIEELRESLEKSLEISTPKEDKEEGNVK